MAQCLRNVSNTYGKQNNGTVSYTENKPSFNGLIYKEF